VVGYRVKMPGGGVAFVDGGKPRGWRCGFCFLGAALRCDWPVAEGKTCDARMCPDHATKVGPDRDYCPAHAAGQK